VQFSHRFLESEPLRSIGIFSTIENLQKLPSFEKELFDKHLGRLFTSNNDFEMGPQVRMTPPMQTAISKIFHTKYQGSARLLFLKSQVLELLAHYFDEIRTIGQPKMKQVELEKIHLAKEIITRNIDQPPTLTELSKLIGLNSHKLKKNFKQLFGVPVFKYLQNQRLQRAHQLLSDTEMTVQEVAWFVGYESLSSFSNAFYQKYGFRPSKVAK